MHPAGVTVMTLQGLRFTLNLGPNLGLRELGSTQSRLRTLILLSCRHISLNDSAVRDAFVRKIVAGRVSSGRLHENWESPAEAGLKVAASTYANPWTEIVTTITENPVAITAEAIAAAAAALKFSHKLLDLWVRVGALPEEIAARKAAYRAQIAKSEDPDVRALVERGRRIPELDPLPSVSGPSPRPVSEQVADQLISAVAELPVRGQRDLKVDELDEDQVAEATRAVRIAGDFIAG
jgi:hypothetical protein